MTNNPELVELKPCPLCASGKIKMQPNHEFGDVTHEILCRGCGLMLMRDTKQVLIAAWNTRALPRTSDGEVGWQPRIGEEVSVIPDCADWASDWVNADGTPLRLWVAGVDAEPGGGYNVTVSEHWPLRPRSGPFSGNALADGFYVGRPDGCDYLSPAALAKVEQP